jgi:hypothetical protein
LSEPTGTVFRHCPNPDGTFTDADIPDPLESEWAFVNTSNAYPDVGEGLFAKKSVPAFTFFAFFGGRIYSADEWKSMKTFDPIYARTFDDTKVFGCCIK